MSSKKDLLLLDNRLNISSTAETTQVVPISGLNVQPFLMQCSGSGPFNANIIFSNLVTPSLSSTLVSRNMRLLYTVQVAYPSTAAGGLGKPTMSFPKAQYDPSYTIDSYLRAWPLQSVCDSVLLTINGSTVTMPTRNVLSPLMRTIPKDYLKLQASEAPCEADSRAVLLPDTGTFSGAWSLHAYPADGTTTTVTMSNGMHATWVSGPAFPAANTKVACTITEFPGLRAYWIAGVAFIADAVYPIYVDQAVVSGQSTSKFEACDHSSRASFKATSFSQNVALAGATTQTYGYDVWTFQISEPIFISPLTLHDKESFLANINTLSLQLNFSQLNDMIICSGLVPSSAINPSNLYVSITTPNPQLELTYITVPNDLIRIPAQVSYDLNQAVYFPKFGYVMSTSADAVSTLQVVSDTIRLQNMPSLMYIFARQTIASRTSTALSNYACKSTDTFLGIGDPVSGQAQVQIQLGSRPALLGASSNKQIYRMCVENGYQGSWEDWSYGGQGMLVINPTKDLGLNLQAGDSLPNESGSSVNFQISMLINTAPFNYVSDSKAHRELLGVPETMPVEFGIVAIYSGCCTISPDGFIQNMGDLTPKDVEMLLKTAPKTEGGMISSEMLTPTIKGGGLLVQKRYVGRTAHA